MEKQKALEQKFEKLVLEIQEKINKKEQEFQVGNVYKCLIIINNLKPKPRYCFFEGY